MSAARMGALHWEHVLLGAEFEESFDGLLAAAAYGAEASLDDALEGAALADLSGCAYALVSGSAAPALAHAALAGSELAVGQAAFEAVLGGDGRLVAAPLAMRTGESELVLLDPSERGAALVAWLEFLQGIEASGAAPYADAAVEDATGMLVPLLLAGRRATVVLSDYAPEELLPSAGEVRQVTLDAIPAVVARASAPQSLGACYVVMVSPAAVRRLWRSLLSFTEVSPLGHRSLRALLSRELPWGALLDVSAAALPSASQLRAWGLLREGSDYVGARALNGND